MRVYVFCECLEIVQNPFDSQSDQSTISRRTDACWKFIGFIGETIKNFILIYYVSQSYLSDSNNTDRKNDVWKSQTLLFCGGNRNGVTVLQQQFMAFLTTAIN